MIFIPAAFIFAQNPSLQSPKYETRAVWIATLPGHDWPKTVDTAEQKSSLRRIIASLKAANFNTIFFQIRGRGDAMYNSNYEPWSPQLTGTLGKNPGWDPLSYIIEEAHKSGMELHAWFNTFIVRSAVGKQPESLPRHIILQHPEWVRFIDNEWWLDPGIPAVREYLIKVAMEVLRKYDIDGFQFDYIRYPGNRFPDDAAYALYGKHKPKNDWRRDNITSLVYSFYDSAIAVKPMLKIGSAPIGIYTNFPGVNGWQSYYELFQDSRKWLQEGKHDYLVPQLYWPVGIPAAGPDYALLAKEWAGNSFSRHIYLGIGAYKPEVSKQLSLYIDIARSVEVSGMAFFRYTSIESLLNLDDRYKYPAIIPPMPWKDSVPPERPINLKIVNIADDIFMLSWEKPSPASDGDGPKYFNIYRSIETPVDISDSKNFLASIAGFKISYCDTIVHPFTVKYHYAVSAVDKGNNESPPSGEETIFVTERVDLLKQLNYNFKLGKNYPDPASQIVYFPYEIKGTAPVLLKIVNDKNEEIMNVVDSVKREGRYIAAADISKFKDGIYSCVFSAGDYSLRRYFRVDN